MGSLSSWLLTQKQPTAGMVKPTNLPSAGLRPPATVYPNVAGAGATGNKLMQKQVTTPSMVPQPPPPPQYSGPERGGAPGMGSFTGGYQFNAPQIPGEYQLTDEDLARFYAQATNEAAQLFDPQVLSLQQVLAKNLLAAEQSGSGVQANYDAVIKSVDEWKAQAIKDEQARWFARGLGVGGGLVQAETELETKAMGFKTTAGTEKAQKLSDIAAQKQLLTEQGGQSEQSLVTQKAQYIVTRRQEIEDAYTSHKEAIAQQQFQNQMAVEQLGMTAQAQAFDQWLQQTSLANDIWYQGAQMALAELENTQSEQYRQEALKAKGTGTGSALSNLMSGSGSTIASRTAYQNQGITPVSGQQGIPIKMPDGTIYYGNMSDYLDMKSYEELSKVPAKKNAGSTGVSLGGSIVGGTYK